MRGAFVLAAVTALVAAAPAVGAKLPGAGGNEGVPFKTYATVSPRVHLFGDAITARLAIVADTKQVDPAGIRVTTSFTPYRATHGPNVQRLSLGRFAQLTWTWTLRCLTPPCVPQLPPSDKFHVFDFAPIHIAYPSSNGKKLLGIKTVWPPVEVLSQVTPGVVAYLQKTHRLNWQFHVTPVASPTYRVSPGLLFWLALAAGLAVLLAATALGRAWYRIVRPPPVVAVRAPTPSSPFDRALAVLAWAHARRDDTLERKALERVADELVVDEPAPEVEELLRAARELAWSPAAPEDQDVQTFTERARETRRRAQPDEVPE